MGTTLNDEVARVGADRSTDDLERTIGNFHKSLADASALLSLEVERLWDEESGGEDPKRYDKLAALAKQGHRALQQIGEIESKLGLGRLDEKNALNLEEARAEILRRLACIAAVQKAGSVP